MSHKPRSHFLHFVLCAALPLLQLACSGDQPAEEKPAEYAHPSSYMDIEYQVGATALRLKEITREAGIDFQHETGAFGKKWMPETMGSGGGFLDYNSDGKPDIFLVNGAEWAGRRRRSPPATPALYKNLGQAKFENVTRSAGLDFSFYGMGCSFADYDSDGDPDIYVTAVGTNKLLRNDGGRFREVTAEAGVSGNSPERGAAPAWSSSAAWFDYDRDGWLDLFVCNYVKWTPETDIFTTLDGKNKSYATPEQYEGQSSRLYRNIHGRRFADVTQQAGLFNPSGKSLGVAIADLNDDGWPDLVVSNDTQPNFLYMNNGDGTFREIGLQAGIAYDELGRARAGMGVDVADYANNGRFGIAIGNFAREPLSLYTQIAATLFQDRAGAVRITKPSLLRLTFGVLFADFDLDGFQDLVMANGHIEPQINEVQQDITFAQPPLLFRNDTRGRFVDVSKQTGEAFARPIVGRGVATADIDDDGDPDVLITTNGDRPKLFRNDLPREQANWLKLQLSGRRPNLNAIGAKVTVWAAGARQIRFVRTGSSYLSQSDISELVFGLGKAGQADSLVIRWPTTGERVRLGPASARKKYRIREEKPELEETR